MAQKDWLLGLGERSGNPEDTDVLLKSKISERKRKEIARQEEEDEATHTAKMAELKKKTATSEAAVDKSGEKKEPGSGIQVEGSVKLGTIDYQDLLQKRMDERDELRKQAEDAASRQQAVSDDLREKLHASEMQVLKTSFDAQMQILTKMIESNASKGNFADQLNAAREIAKELGYSQGTPGGGSEMVQVEIKKLDFEHQVAMRKMAREDKMSDRNFQIELRRLDDDRDARKAELTQKEKRDQMFYNAPAVVGQAIAQGLLKESGGEVSSAPKGKQHYELSVPIGEGGTTKCPECQIEVGVGPTAKSAICASCGTKIFIKRVEGQKEPPVIEEGEE